MKVSAIFFCNSSVPVAYSAYSRFPVILCPNMPLQPLQVRLSCVRIRYLIIIGIAQASSALLVLVDGSFDCIFSTISFDFPHIPLFYSPQLLLNFSAIGGKKLAPSCWPKSVAVARNFLVNNLSFRFFKRVDRLLRKAPTLRIFTEP